MPEYLTLEMLIKGFFNEEMRCLIDVDCREICLIILSHTTSETFTFGGRTVRVERAPTDDDDDYGWCGMVLMTLGMAFSYAAMLY